MPYNVAFATSGAIASLFCGVQGPRCFLQLSCRAGLEFRLLFTHYTFLFDVLGFYVALQETLCLKLFPSRVMF